MAARAQDFAAVDKPTMTAPRLTPVVLTTAANARAAAATVRAAI